jgi:hypothetical protein
MFGVEGRMGEEAEAAQAVVEGHHHDPAPGQGRAVEH